MAFYRGILKERDVSKMDEFERSRYVTERKTHQQHILVQGHKLDMPIGVDVQVLSILAPESPGSPV
eukprot:7883911-Karenia_brevis.AAC.1